MGEQVPPDPPKTYCPECIDGLPLTFWANVTLPGVGSYEGKIHKNAPGLYGGSLAGPIFPGGVALLAAFCSGGNGDLALTTLNQAAAYCGGGCTVPGHGCGGGGGCTTPNGCTLSI